MKGFTQRYEDLVRGQKHLEVDQVISSQDFLKQKPTLTTQASFLFPSNYWHESSQATFDLHKLVISILNTSGKRS
jgi:hypothetical protein